MTAKDRLWLIYTTVIPNIRLPASVLIENIRLTLFFRLLQLCALVLVVGILYTGRSFYKVEAPDGSITYWIDYTPEEYQDQVRLDRNKDICNNSAKYDYVYDEMWTYTNYSCTELTANERFQKDGNSLFIPLSYAETKDILRPLPLVANSSDPDACSAVAEPCSTGWVRKRIIGVPGKEWACQCEEQTQFFVAGSQSLSISFEHFYEMIREGADAELASRQHSSTSCEKDRWKCAEEGDGASKELKTVVLLRVGSKHQPLQVDSSSGSSFSLNMGELLRAAGVDLDSENRNTVENKLLCKNGQAGNPEGCVPEAKVYPLVRMTGAEIRFQMKYYNRFMLPDTVLKDFTDLRSHLGPVCIISARVNPKWTSKPGSDCSRPRKIASVEADCTGRYFYGVNVGFDVAGTFGFFDGMQLLFTLGSSLTYLSMPFWIVYFVTMYCLGPLSRFYRHTCNEECRLDDAFVGFVARSISAMASFKLIAGEADSIDKTQVLKEIERAFHTLPGFGLEEQENLAELVMDRLAKQPKSQGEGAGAALASEEKEPRIYLREFVQSIAPQKLSQPLHKLLRTDRRRNPFEVLFMPKQQFQVNS